MSSSVPSRLLSLTPFIVADGVLLLTALLIAWGASGELTGGALVGVVFCTALGAILAVVPFVLKDVRERDAALAARQRELVELVSSSTATTSRWGAQWAAAATGLEDAAGLATRNLAAAERLPAIFQEKIDAFTNRLDRVELDARARDERALQQEATVAHRAEQAALVTAALERTLAEFARMETSLRDQHSALATTLAELPAATARAQAVRDAIDERLDSAPAQLETHATRLTTETGMRLTAMTEALVARVVELETALGSLTEHVERAKTLTLAVTTPAPARPASEPAAPAAVDLAPVPPVIEAASASCEVCASTATHEAPVVASHEPTVMSVCEKTVAPSTATTTAVRKDVIMDPFYIPHDGYSALADAMDNGRS